MNIAVIGSRGITDEALIETYLDRLNEQIPCSKVITGGAMGVDTIAEKWAEKNNIESEIIRPVDKTQKINYLYRNIEIITKSDLIVAFWDSKSKGTEFVIDYAMKRGKKIIVNTTNGKKMMECDE